VPSGWLACLPGRWASARLVRVPEWRPLSKRGKADATLDSPTEGLPPYLLGPVAQWMASVCRNRRGGMRDEALTRLQLRFKLEPPLSREPRLGDLISRMEVDEDFGLDVLDYMLHHVGDFTDEYDRPIATAAGLAGVLNLGGSAWEVVPTDDGAAYQLARRAVGPVREAIADLPASSRGHQHLVAAWNRLSGRNPDPSGAYREAVRAVEAAAKPVILPDNDRATLGQMIAAMRDKPEKWQTTMGTVNHVCETMETVWTSQLDRHGTDDESVPLNVSQPEADAAFHWCLTLARLFVGGHVRRS
jgi:hypothetical protein